MNGKKHSGTESMRTKTEGYSHLLTKVAQFAVNQINQPITKINNLKKRSPRGGRETKDADMDIVFLR